MPSRSSIPQSAASRPVILALESSGAACSVALATGSGGNSDKRSDVYSGSDAVILAETSFYEPHQHDERLALSASALLEALGITVSSLAAVCVSAGPGSFTGLRIGVALAKALCFEEFTREAEIEAEAEGASASSKSTPSKMTLGTAPQYVSVPTLNVYAFEARFYARLAKAEAIVVATVSHKNLVYVQRFSVDAEPLVGGGGVNNDAADNEWSEARLMEWESVAAHIRKGDYCCGGAFAAFASAPFSSPAVAMHPSLARATAAMTARLGWQMYQRGEFVRPADALPLYVQDFVPKVAASAR